MPRGREEEEHKVPSGVSGDWAADGHCVSHGPARRAAATQFNAIVETDPVAKVMTRSEPFGRLRTEGGRSV